MQHAKLLKNVHLLRFGQPFKTEAVVLPLSSFCTLSPKCIQVTQTDSTTVIHYPLELNDIVYGMGENTGSIDKRGKKFVCYCTDDHLHTPDKQSLYGSHPFLIVDKQNENKQPFGLFIDFPGEITFDIGFTNRNLLEVTIPSLDVDIYELHATNKKQIIRQFRQLTGTPYVPPRWGFGYQQCRWSYHDSNEVDKIINGFRSNDIPCDTIYLDIDYMVEYKNFTIDNNKFPNFAKYVAEKKQQGIRLIPIIDAGVPVSAGYSIYEEGVENGYFCKQADGDQFEAAVWPGLCVFPDYLNSDVRQWWGNQYRQLIEQGIEGFWNDMNEPALFYSKQGIEQVHEMIDQMRSNDCKVQDFFKLNDMVRGLSNNREDYKSIYHTTKDGEIVNNHDVHNLYGLNMTRAAAEGFAQICPEKRILLFSRASGIGAHRYAGIWLGDNMSWWEHILLNIRMMPAINMCGFLYSGADVGGFGCDASADLLIRWTQFALFMPLFRNHAAGTRYQEPFAFDEYTTTTIREHIKLRYMMIPYIYSEYMRAVQNNDCYCWQLGFEYSDTRSARVDDQLLLGHSMMCTPIYTENARGRHVYLPEPMLLWKVAHHTGREMCQLPAGDHWLDLQLDELPVFIRPNKMLPLTDTADNVDAQALTHLEVLVNLHNEASYTLYHDDGVSRAYQQGDFAELALAVKFDTNSPDGVAVNAQVMCGYIPYQQITFHIITSSGDRIIKNIRL